MDSMPNVQLRLQANQVHSGDDLSDLVYRHSDEYGRSAIALAMLAQARGVEETLRLIDSCPTIEEGYHQFLTSPHMPHDLRRDALALLTAVLLREPHLDKLWSITSTYPSSTDMLDVDVATTVVDSIPTQGQPLKGGSGDVHYTDIERGELEQWMYIYTRLHAAGATLYASDFYQGAGRGRWFVPEAMKYVALPPWRLRFDCTPEQIAHAGHTTVRGRTITQILEEENLRLAHLSGF